MNKQRFYIDTRGTDDKAYQEAMQYACQLANENSNIDRIILLAATKGNTGWLDRLYGDQTVKKLFKGTTFKDCKPTFKIETLRTYSDGPSKDIVICMGLKSEDVFKVDDFYAAEAIIAIPWIPEHLEEWIKTWSPIELRTKKSAEGFELPDPIIQVAMKELTNDINMTTGITHPSDEHQAKTYVRALHKYMDIDGEIVAAYLTRELGWDTEHALDLKKLIDTLNAGKYFKGGDKTFLKNYINEWKKKLKK